jgi:hypothetical protein
MALKLIPPGKRKDNPFYLVRGRLLGEDYEVSTETTDPLAAARFKNVFERSILEGRVPGPGEDVGFHKAAELYAAARDLSKQDEQRIARLKTAIADKACRLVIQADIDGAATTLYPGAPPETRNRNVHTPAASILHYAAENQWCPWLRVKRPKMRRPETRAAAPAVAPLLLANTAGKEHLLVLWLFKHGSRITMALQTDCARIDLHARTYELYVSKNKTWKTFPIDDEVWDLLANDSDVQRGTGRLFPWKSRDRVYEWLRPLAARLGVKFTPHMARHRLGKDLNAAGAGLKTIMEALGQLDEKSAARYATADVEIVRAATQRLRKLLATSG